MDLYVFANQLGPFIFFLDLRTSLVHVGVRLLSGSVSISNPWWGPSSLGLVNF